METFFQIIKTIILGIVEGVTEWLPISSTGHMIITDVIIEEVFNLKWRQDFVDIFLIVIQLGAILAVVFLFWNKIWPFHLKGRGELFFKESSGKKLNVIQTICNNYIHMDKIILWIKILIASIPAAVIGLIFDKQIEQMLTGDMRAFVVAAMLVVYGILFIIIESIGKREKIFDTKSIDYKTALFIGLMQCLAIVPGTSRSGITILGAILLGCTRNSASEFSFFLSIPAMLGASAISFLEFFIKGKKFIGNEPILLLIGCGVAFLVSVLAIKFLLSYIKKHDFKAFGWYRIVLGIILVIYFSFIA